MTSKCMHFIAQPDVFGQKGSEKGSKMAPTLIKPMENHQMSSPGNILLYEIFFLYIQKKASHVGIMPGQGMLDSGDVE